MFNTRIGDVSGRGKLASDMREIWLMQPRFEKRAGSSPFGLVEQPRFRAAFDFMRLRADDGEIDVLLSDWWQAFSLADDNLRQDMVDEVRRQQPQRARALRGSANNASPPVSSETAPPEAAIDAAAGSGAPRKRHRRRRAGGISGRDAGGTEPS